MTKPDYTALAERLDKCMEEVCGGWMLRSGEGWDADEIHAATAAIRDLQERLAWAERELASETVLHHEWREKATRSEEVNKLGDGLIAKHEARALAAERQRDEAVEVLRKIEAARDGLQSTLAARAFLALFGGEA